MEPPERTSGTIHQPVVTLRRALPRDAGLLHAWRSEPSASRYQPLRSMSLAAVRDELRQYDGVPFDRDFAGKARWIIEHGGVPTGWISLAVLDREHGRGTIGYTIGEAFRGQGLATAAVRLLIVFACSPAGLDLARLEAVTAVGNRASQRVLEHAGFTREGRAVGLLVIDGHRVDHFRYGLPRDDANDEVPEAAKTAGAHERVLDGW